MSCSTQNPSQLCPDPAAVAAAHLKRVAKGSLRLRHLARDPKAGAIPRAERVGHGGCVSNVMSISARSPTNTQASMEPQMLQMNFLFWGTEVPAELLKEQQPNSRRSLDLDAAQPLLEGHPRAEAASRAEAPCTPSGSSPRARAGGSKRKPSRCNGRLVGVDVSQNFISTWTWFGFHRLSLGHTQSNFLVSGSGFDLDRTWGPNRKRKRDKVCVERSIRLPMNSPRGAAVI